MRRIGTLDSAPSAEAVHRYLELQGIGNTVQPADANWEIWVYEESQLNQARAEFDDYLKNPTAAKYQSLPAPEKSKPVVPPMRPGPVPVHPVSNSIPVTIFITLLCAGITLATRFGHVKQLANLFFMSVSPDGSLDAVMQGQVWRLLTPIFLHFSIMHLGFNLYIFWMLGNAIERVRGSLALLGIVITVGLLSNMVQYLSAGPNFGGLSGVVYGLFGYLWMRSVFLPGDGFFMPQSIVTQMIFWAVLCVLMEDVFPVANGAHFGGLVVGMALGAAPRLWRTSRR